jgi:hypothetical protein
MRLRLGRNAAAVVGNLNEEKLAVAARADISMRPVPPTA